jgi:hypothetical protein
MDHLLPASSAQIPYPSAHMFAGKGAGISIRRSGAEKRSSLEQLSPKRFFDFLTDPSLLITVLHSLEVAYWTFPFGFVLTPVINFFRVPNRRSLDAKSGRRKRSSLNDPKLKLLHVQLMKSIEKAEKYGLIESSKTIHSKKKHPLISSDSKN